MDGPGAILENKEIRQTDAWTAYIQASNAGSDIPEADTFFVLPVLDPPGGQYVVFSDGSYVKDWIPATP